MLIDNTKKIRVVVVDDHPAYREGLCRLLNEEDDIEVAGMAANASEAIALTKELQPDVVTLDIAMPGLNGIEGAKQVKTSCPKTAILIISAYDYEHYVLTAIRAGVAGYLLKDAPVRDIISAVRLVRNGESVFNFKSASNILQRLSAKGVGTKAPEELHGRELDVLILVAKGTSNKEIGKQLVISERTVQSHLVNIFRKLGVASRTEAVIKALKLGLFRLDELT